MARVLMLVIVSLTALGQHYEIIHMGVSSRDRASNVFGRYTGLTDLLNENLTNEQIQSDIKLRIYDRESEITKAFESSRLDVAVISPVTLLVMRSRGIDVEVIGAEIRYKGVVDEAVIVTPKSVSVMRLEDIKGRAFAFGPVNDPLFDWGARAALAKAGLRGSELTTKNYDDFDRLSELIQLGRYQAGILPVSYVEKPDHPFRVLAECRAPFRIWVMRTELIPFTKRGLKQTLTELNDPRILNRLDISGIDAIDPEDLQDFEDVLRLAMVFGRN